MSHSLTAVIGLGIALGSTALVQPEPVQSEEITQTEIAPGTAIPPLGTRNARVPAFVILNPAAPGAIAEAEPSLTIGTSGLAAFGLDGIRMPAYEPPEIATGSVKRIPRR